MQDTLLLAIALSDTVAIAVADTDGAIIVQTAYPNDAAAGPDLFLSHLLEEAQVLLYPLPGELRQVGLGSAPGAAPGDAGWLAARLAEALGARVACDLDPLPASERAVEEAITLARRALA